MQHFQEHFDGAPAAERRWRNTAASFGLVTIAFHWAIAVLFLAQLGLGYWMSRDNIDPVLQFDLFQYHKSIGFLVLTLAVPRLLWSLFSRRPRALDGEGLVSGWPRGPLMLRCCFLPLPFRLPVGQSRRHLLCRSPAMSSISSSCQRCPWRSRTRPKPSGRRFTLLWPISQQLSSFFM